MKTEAVFFDATGTLIEVRHSVGSVYAEIGRRFGIGGTLGAGRHERLEEAFRKSLNRAEPLAFPSARSRELEDLERSWWRRRVRETLLAGGAGEGTHFEEFFDAVFGYFAQPQAWRLVPGCRTVLERLTQGGLRLAVVSNFDSRLPRLLRELGIGEHFETVVYSSRAGAAKPHPRIFARALQETGLAAGAALHVGDSLELDVFGARSAGLQAVLFDPLGRCSDDDRIHRIKCLTDIPGFLL